jgi:uncharacterized phage protein (TIGR02218 family)
MAYADKEAAVQQVDSFELFTFVTSANTYRYTSYATDVTLGGNTYQAVSIQRGELVTNMVQGMISCNLQAPVSVQFMQYIIAMPYLSTTVTIQKYFSDDTTDGTLLFTGKINSISISKNVANVECASSMNELNRKIPRVFIQSFCNNSLYGDVCGLNRTAWRYTIPNITVDPNNPNLLTGNVGVYGNDWFTAGYAEFNGEQRYISKHTGNNIILHFRFLGLITGDTIYLYPGCSKNPETCKKKFNNLNNFVGMPYISKSPNPTIYGVD